VSGGPIPVERRTLGRTGVSVGALALGTWMLGPEGNADEEECRRMIHRSLEAGVNLIDTADSYSGGRSEEIVGRAIRGRRDGVVLATKVHFPMGDDPNERGNARRWILRAAEDSLRRLQTDHIDLYQIHRPDPSTDLEEVLGALTNLVRAGKVRYPGCSTFPAWMIVEARAVAERRGLEGFRSEQAPYSILVRGIERDVLPVARRLGMGTVVWSPLAGGWLAGRYRRGREPDPRSRSIRWAEKRSRVSARYDLSRAPAQRKLDAVEALTRVAEEAGLRLAHLAVAFTLAHPGVSSSIIGPRTLEQLEDLLAGAEVRLGDDVLEAIDSVVPPGTVLDDVDRGWEEPWMAPARRRRSAGEIRESLTDVKPPRGRG
jgi:aryl-alcohol dehydrogenase-like predicted oxidoreductase